MLRGHRCAARALSLAKAQAPAGAAAVHTYVKAEDTMVDPSVYEKEEHKWDPNGRDARFPKTVSVPEGAFASQPHSAASLVRTLVTSLPLLCERSQRFVEASSAVALLDCRAALRL